MTDDLATRLNTAGAFDTPWLKEQLRNWSVKEQQRRADFMEHLYQCSGRNQDGHPERSLYTGLWQDFCIREAGYAMRDRWFDMQEAIRRFEAGELEPMITPFATEGLQ